MRIASLSLFLASGVLLAASTPTEYRISGPYTHENLSIYLIHGKGAGKQYVTLKEAMESRKVIVYETKSVNELAVENVSGEPVFINGGDIVKGGQQDRVLTNDFVLPPKSGKMPISAFCVEHGRWTRRGAEQVQTFGSSAEMVATKDLKMAVRVDKSQPKVWEEVAKTQDRLEFNARSMWAQTRHVPAPIAASVSPSSLQLSLESPTVVAAVDGYLKSLSGVTAGKNDVIGFAFAVNGNLNSADVYSSSALFTALWPKLLKASAVEAIRLRQSDAGPPAASVAAIEKFLRNAESGKQSTVDVDKRVKLVSRESDKQLLLESREGDGWIHRSYLSK